LMNGLKIIKSMAYIPAEVIASDDEVGLKVSTPCVQIDEKKVADIKKSVQAFYDAMNDDLNTAVAVAQLFNMLKYINMLYLNQLVPAALGEEGFGALKNNFVTFTEELLGLQEERSDNDAVLSGMLDLYREYKAAQQYDKVDQIRSYFKAQNLVIRDMKHRIDWAYEE
jgi:cysteinyl-tRNA synthetase